MIFSPKKKDGVTAKLALAAVSLCLVSTLATAGGLNEGSGGKSYVERAGGGAKGGTPTTNNTTPASFRALVPDGSSLFQSWGGDATKWYGFTIEPGKTYVVEAFDPYTDYANGSVAGLGIYDLDGTTSPPPETNVDCGQSLQTPALDNFGARCVIRAYVPQFTSLQARRVYVRVNQWVNTSFQIRVRESTIYGRWTTNGYDFHVEVQNTTAQAQCVQVIYYPNSGLTYSGSAWSGSVDGTSLNIPPFGAAKVVRANGTLVGSDNKGPLRIGACPGSPMNLTPGAIQVNTLGFSSTLNQFLPYPNVQINGGNGSSF
jgi:hypothetical protein